MTGHAAHRRPAPTATHLDDATLPVVLMVTTRVLHTHQTPTCPPLAATPTKIAGLAIAAQCLCTTTPNGTGHVWRPGRGVCSIYAHAAWPHASSRVFAHRDEASTQITAQLELVRACSTLTHACAATAFDLFSGRSVE